MSLLFFHFIYQKILQPFFSRFLHFLHLQGVCLGSRGFCPGALSGVFLSGRFCPGCFLSVPLLLECIRFNNKLNITSNFRIQECDVTCSWTPPLSQTVTSSRSPP